MIKNILIVLNLICFPGLGSYAQTYLIQAKPEGSRYWKYINLNSKIVIDAEYPVCYQFSKDGIGVVSYPKKNLYLFIDTKGKQIETEIKGFIVKDVFGYGAKGYSDGMIIVRIGKKYGCLDTKGKQVVPFHFDNILEFENGFGTGRIDEDYYIIGKDGSEKKIENDNIIDVKKYQEGLAPFKSTEVLFGFIDTNGDIAIQANFLNVGYFKNGLAWAKDLSGLIGYINPKGEWVITPQFSVAKDFDKESGLARIKKEAHWAYVNEKGEIVDFNLTNVIDDFSDGLAKGKVGNQIGFYNNKGEWVIKPQFNAVRDFKNGYAAAKYDGLWGIINKEGKWVIKPAYSGMRDVVKINSIK